MYQIEKAGQSDGAVISTRVSASALQKTCLTKKKKANENQSYEPTFYSLLEFFQTPQLIKYWPILRAKPSNKKLYLS